MIAVNRGSAPTLMLSLALAGCAGEGMGATESDGTDSSEATTSGASAGSSDASASAGSTAGTTTAGTTTAGTTTAGTTTAGTTTAGTTTAGTTTAGTTTAGTTTAGTTGDPGTCTMPAEHMGDGTYYGADGSGNCSFDPSPGDLMVAAINDPEYAGSAPCGACAHVVGPMGAVTVRIVDRCPECLPGDLDLSPQAFELLAPLEEGRIDITWTFVPCAVDGPLRYRFKEGSSQWWTAVQVRNHRHAIASFEYSNDGGETYVPVAREDYNYFVAAEGMGPDPLMFRVTDVLGDVIVDEGLVVGDAVEVAGAAQFPACE